MSGLEIVGLVLAVVPIVTASAEHYRKVYGAASTALRTSVRDEKLANHYQHLHNEVSLLYLTIRNLILDLPTISSGDKYRLLELDGQLWEDDRVSLALSQKLGTANEAFVDTLGALLHTLDGMLSDRILKLSRPDVVKQPRTLYKKLEILRAIGGDPDSLKGRIRFTSSDSKRRKALVTLIEQNKTLERFIRYQPSAGSIEDPKTNTNVDPWRGPLPYKLAGSIANSDGLGPGMPSDAFGNIQNSLQDDDGNESMYPNLLAPSERQEVEMKFTAVLCKTLREQGVSIKAQHSSHHFSSLLRSRIVEYSDTVKAKIPKTAESRPKRRVARTIKQHATQIAYRFESMNYWGVEEEDLGGRPLTKFSRDDGIPEESAQQKVRRFLNEDSSERLEDLESAPVPGQSDPDSSSSESSDFGYSAFESSIPQGSVGDTGTSQTSLNYDSLYTEFTSHPAFSHLIWQTSQLIKHYRSDVLSEIRACILTRLSAWTGVSEEKTRSQAMFCVDWNMLAFMVKSCGIMDEEVTITGNGLYAQMETVVSYIDQVWSQQQTGLLDALQDAYWHYLETGQNWTQDESDHGSELIVSVSFLHGRVSATAVGSAEFLVTVGQQLAWIGAACQTDSSASKEGFIYSHTLFSGMSSNSGIEHPTFWMRYDRVRLLDTEEPRPWTFVVGGYPLASGFPVAKRHENDVGLQIPHLIVRKRTPQGEHDRQKKPTQQEPPLIVDDVSLVRAWMASIDQRISPKTLDTALRSRRRENVELCLTHHFEDVAQGPYAWLYESRILEGNIDTLVENLVERFEFSPWISFERSSMGNVVKVDPDHHIPACVHKGGERNLESLQGSAGVVVTQMKHQSSANRLIQECCGIGGIAPDKGLEDLDGFVKFSKANTAVTVSYGHSGSQPLSPGAVFQMISALESFCRGATVAQRAGICCNCFTFFRHSGAPGHVEMVRLNLLDAAELLSALQFVKHFKDPLSTVHREVWSTVARKASAVIHKVGQIESGQGSATSESEVIEHSAHLCSLAVQFLCLAFLSYRQAHMGPIKPFFLDTPQCEASLLGNLTNHGNMDYPRISAKLVELSCLGIMTKSPVLSFRIEQHQDSNLSWPVGLKFDVLAALEDVADTWGPAKLLSNGESDQTVNGLIVGGGVIFPNDETGKSFHWWRFENVPSTFPTYSTDIAGKVLIGTAVDENYDCRLDWPELRRQSARFMDELETKDSSFEHTGTSIGLSAVLYKFVSVTATRSYTKDPRRTLKDVILDNSMIDLYANLQRHCGLQVSFCAGVARRVSLQHLMADVLPCVIPSGFQIWENIQSRGKVSDVFRGTKDVLEQWMSQQSEEEKKAIFELIQEVLKKLKSTGFDSRKKHLSICWFHKDLPSMCFKVLPEEGSVWVPMLADSTDCATFAYITPKCLVTTSNQCGGASPKYPLWSRKSVLLETTVRNAVKEVCTEPFGLIPGSTYYIGDEPMQALAHRYRDHDRPDLIISWGLFNKSRSKIRGRFHIPEARRNKEVLSCDYTKAETTCVSLYAMNQLPHHDEFAFAQSSGQNGHAIC